MKRWNRLLAGLVCLVILAGVTGCQPGTEGNIGQPIGGALQYGPKEELPDMEQTEQNTLLITETEGDSSGKNDSAPALKKAIDRLGQKGFILFPKGEYLIETDVSVPETIVLVMNKGARLEIADDATLTVNGFIDADASRIFGGSGTLSGVIRGAGYPQWFGMAGKVDDSDIFNQAFARLNYVKVPKIDGGYTVNNLVISKPTTVEGIGGIAPEFRITAHAKRFMTIRSGNVAIKNIHINGKDALPECVGYYLDHSKGDLSGLSFSDLYARQLGTFFVNEHSDQYRITKAEFLACRIDRAKFGGYRLYDLQDEIRMNSIQTQNLGAPFDVTHPGFLLENCRGVTIGDLDVTGGRMDGEKGGATVLRNCMDLTLDRAMMEWTNGVGLLIEGCSKFEINQFVVGPFDGEGVYMKDCSNGQMNVTLLIGENYAGSTTLTPDGKYAPAMVLEKCRDMIFNDMQVYRLFDDGIHLIDTEGTVFNSLTFSDIDKNAYVEVGNSNKNTVNGMILNNVKGTQITQIGTDSRLNGVVLKDNTAYETVVGKATY